MDHLSGKYSKQELEELRKVLNSRYGEEYISGIFDKFQLAMEDELPEEDKLRMLENIHTGINIEELIHSIETEQKRQHHFSDKSRTAIPARKATRKNTRIWMYSALILLIFTFVLSIDYFVGNKEDRYLAASVPFVEKSTAKGQKLTIRLVDGTKVVLNSGSSIRYPETFTDSLREVYIKGEAYFEVTHDETKPFIVHAGGLRSQVLGTSFNVKFFPEISVNQVALVTGKVKVSRTDANDTDVDVILLPGEMASLSSGHVRKGTFDLAKETGWKDNIIVFKDADFPEVFATLENWYGVNIDYQSIKNGNAWKLTAKFEDVSLEKVLKAISDSQHIRFEIKGTNVKIKS